MNIPNQYYEILITEFKDVENLCNQANSREDKLYLFTASFGILNRIMNLHIDPILIFTHQILQNAHQAFQQRQSVALPNALSRDFPEILFNSLFIAYSDLINAFEKKDDDLIRLMLEKISLIAYATSGNGFYLYLRGKILI